MLLNTLFIESCVHWASLLCSEYLLRSLANWWLFILSWFLIDWVLQKFKDSCLTICFKLILLLWEMSIIFSSFLLHVFFSIWWKAIITSLCFVFSWFRLTHIVWRVSILLLHLIIEVNSILLTSSFFVNSETVYKFLLFSLWRSLFNMISFRFKNEFMNVFLLQSFRSLVIEYFGEMSVKLSRHVKFIMDTLWL